jgi:hypothetical protein
MNGENSPPRAHSRSTVLIPVVAAVVLLVCIVIFRSHQAKTKAQLDRISGQNEMLRQELADAQAAIRNLSSGDSSVSTKTRLTEKRERMAPQPAAPETETLHLEAPSVESTADGLAANLEYRPDGEATLPERITLVVRVPAGGTARILSLAPTGSGNQSVLEAVINPAGTLGMVECSTAELNSLAFVLEVSEPVTATVRGSEGIIDFELDIQPDGCAVRKL